VPLIQGKKGRFSPAFLAFIDAFSALNSNLQTQFIPSIEPANR